MQDRITIIAHATLAACAWAAFVQNVLPRAIVSARSGLPGPILQDGDFDVCLVTAPVSGGLVRLRTACGQHRRQAIVIMDSEDTDRQRGPPEHLVQIVSENAAPGDLLAALRRALRARHQDNPVAVARSGTFTPRQQMILERLQRGETNKEIARALGITEGTIKAHMRAMMQVAGVKNRTALVATCSPLPRHRDTPA